MTPDEQILMLERENKQLRAELNRLYGQFRYALDRADVSLAERHQRRSVETHEQQRARLMAEEYEGLRSDHNDGSELRTAQ